MFDAHPIPLSRECGVLISLGGHRRGLVHAGDEPVFAGHMNRLYLVQLLQMPAVRYCLADDPHVEEDLVWAGYQLVRRGKGKLRYVKADR
jgi:hypothetical protein